uniref:ERD4-related membrane protein n=1 Tax=Chlorella ohadii TaxID=2649997 RepID=A0AAD5H1R9_9CHLO
MAVSGKSLAITVGIYAIILIVAVLLFSKWRLAKLTRKFYAPKSYVETEGYPKPPPLAKTFGGWVPQVFKMSEAEVIRCAGVDAAMYLKILRMGFEVFLCVGFLVMVIILPINCVGDEVDNLIATNTTATNNATGESYTFTSLDKTTISNIPSRDPALWAHAVITWAVTFVVYWWLWKYNKEALRLRIFHLLNQPAGAESHTVLLQDVPGVAYGTIPNRADGTLLKIIPKSIKQKAFQQTEMLASKGKNLAKGVKVDVPIDLAKNTAADNAAAAAALSTGAINVDATTGRWEMRDEWLTAVNEIQAHDGSVAAMVEETLRRIYHEDLSAVHMVHDTSKLDPLVAEYEKRKQALTDMVDNYISLKRRGKELKVKQMTVIGATMGAWGKEKYGMKPKKVEALEFLRDRLTELRRAIKEAQEEALEPGHVFPAAFATFRNRTSQVVAARTLMSENLGTWRCQGAPRAEEILWPNLGFRVWERTGRSLAMWAAFWAMAAFFMIPVTAVQGLLTMNSFLNFLNKIPIVGALVTGMLPGLALKIFLIIVPIVITIMNKWSGMVSTTQVDLGLISRYFIFQVITVFLGSFIAGTFANQLDQFINNPSSIVTIIGTSAPQTAFFFMTYLLIGAFLDSAFGLMRFVPLIIFWVKSRFLAGTERAKARLWQDQTMTYGTLLPDNTISMLLGLVSFDVHPSRTRHSLASTCQLGLLFQSSKYQLIYTYGNVYQTGGLLFMKVFDQCMVGLAFLHLMMVAILGVKKSVGPPVFCAILWIFDIMFTMAVHKRFWRPQECLSLISAAEMDAKEAATLGAPGKGADEEVRQRYLSPSFKFDEAQHAQALEEAERMRKVVVEGGEDEKLFAQEPEASVHSSAADEAEGRVTATRTDDTAAAGADLEAGTREAEGFHDAVEQGGPGSLHSVSLLHYEDAPEELPGGKQA